MSDYVMLLAPSANHVYAEQAAQLATAELAVTAPGATDVRPTSLAGVDYLAFSHDSLPATQLSAQSNALALFELAPGNLLGPIELPHTDVMDSDLVTIPKYRGKTNELFTRLLTHVTISQITHSPSAQPQPGNTQLNILDPLAGRGTTLLTAWTCGHNAFGVEIDEKAFEQFAGFMKTYLRRKRLKHSADVAPVRREGKLVGRRFDATAQPGVATHGHDAVVGADELSMTVFTGDTRDSAKLFGKRKFDAIITDAPYGVVHGASDSPTPRGKGQRKTANTGDRGHGGRDRSPAALLRQAIPIWAGQLRSGGALGVAWNTYGLDRDELAAICAGAGLTVRNEGPWLDFAHRVDSSIKRDLMVAVNNG